MTADHSRADLRDVTGEVRRTRERVWTVVVAAGAGTRFGGPKQYEQLGDRRVLDWAVSTARAVSDGVVIVVPGTDAAREGGVAGGATRSDSVRSGLSRVPTDATIVCVHDAARPFASEFFYGEVIDAVAAGADGAIPGVAVTDTIKLVGEDGRVVETPDRSRLRAIKTPQAFRAEVLRRAHASGGQGTDDAALVEAVGGRVVVVDGDQLNRKLTTPDDLEWARAVVRGEA